MKWTERLKDRWELTSNLQLVLVLLVFSLAGSSIVFVRKPLFEALGVTAETSLWIWIALYIAVFIPCYQILFLFWGFVLGQWKFAWKFEKKMLRRMRIIKSESN